MSFLIKFVDSFVPLQLFHVKKFAKPKAVPSILRLITTSIFFAGIATFVALFITQGSSYTTESSIEISDISDNEWTCSMASVVTQSIILDSSSEPSEFYNLMNINELKNDCLSNLQLADPCSSESNMLFSAGSTALTQQMIMISASPASASAGNSYYFTAVTTSSDSLLQYLVTYKYDVNIGTLTAGNLGGGFMQYPYPSSNLLYSHNTAAMTKSELGVFVVYSGEGYNLVYFDGSFADAEVIICDSLLISNDNLLNVYTLASRNSSEGYSNSLSYFNPVSSDEGKLIEIEIFNTKSDSVLQFGVFCSHGCTVNDDDAIPNSNSLYLYYISSSYDLYVYHSKVFQLLIASSFAGYPEIFPCAMQVSALSNSVFVISQNISSHSSQLDLFSMTQISFDGTIIQYPFASFGTGIEDFALIQNETSIIFSSATANYQFVMHSLTNASDVQHLLSGFSSSISGWYVCGSEIQHSGLPSSIYSSDCNEGNGISWQVEWADTYFSTQTLFSTYAKEYAASLCNESLYTTICDRVGSLPPYICSRKVYLPFFTVFATAIANSHSLIIVLFMVASFALGRASNGKSNSVNEANESNNVNVDSNSNPLTSTSLHCS